MFLDKICVITDFTVLNIVMICNTGFFVNNWHVLKKHKITHKPFIWNISGICNKKLAARRFRPTPRITRHTALQLFSCFHNRCHCGITVFWMIRRFRTLQSNLLCLYPQMTVLNSGDCWCDLQREVRCSLGTSLTWNSESICLAQILSHPTFLKLWLSTILPNFLHYQNISSYQPLQHPLNQMQSARSSVAPRIYLLLYVL